MATILYKMGHIGPLPPAIKPQAKLGVSTQRYVNRNRNSPPGVPVDRTASSRSLRGVSPSDEGLAWAWNNVPYYMPIGYHTAPKPLISVPKIQDSACNMDRRSENGDEKDDQRSPQEALG